MGLITQTDVLQDLSFLLGESSVPSSGIEDRKRFIQRALERVYRKHPFSLNKITASIPFVSGLATLPANVGQDTGLDVREVVAGTHNDRVWNQVPYEDQDNFSAGDLTYWLEGYEGTGTYFLKSNEADTTLKIRFTTSVPIINASVGTPYPSSMCLARGALIYYRQAEDPQADIAQDEAIFQQEQDEVWSNYHRSRPQQRAKSLSEASGTYLGDMNTIGGF